MKKDVARARREEKRVLRRFEGEMKAMRSPFLRAPGVIDFSSCVGMAGLVMVTKEVVVAVLLESCAYERKMSSSGRTDCTYVIRHVVRQITMTHEDDLGLTPHIHNLPCRGYSGQSSKTQS